MSNVKGVKVDQVYGFKDLEARTHLSNYDNPHKVKVTQIGLTDLAPYIAADGTVDLVSFIKDKIDLQFLLDMLFGEGVYTESPLPQLVETVALHDSSFNSLTQQMNDIQDEFGNIKKVIDAVNGDDGPDPEVDADADNYS